MVTVREVVEEIIKKSPFIEEGIAKDLINLSALAREIQPMVQDELLKDVQEGAIVMALKRLAPQISNKFTHLQAIIKNIGDITVKSNLVDFTYVNSETFFENVKTLINKISKTKDKFFTITQGVSETTIIINADFIDEVKKIFKDEEQVLMFENLSSITAKLPSENINVPGVYYTILKLLAWDGINIVDAVSTSNEITCIFRDQDIDNAFSVFKRLTQ